MFGKEETLCECYIDWSECLTVYRGDYHSHKAFLMSLSETSEPIFKLYCRFKWIEKSELDKRRNSINAIA